MPKKKKHSPRTPKYTRSKSREYLSLSLASQNSPVYPDSAYFAKDISTLETISSSTPIPGEINIMEENITENEGATFAVGDRDDSRHDESISRHDESKNSESKNFGDDSTDNDSLFKALQTKTAVGMMPFKSMLKDLLDGFNQQLRLEIKSDMSQLLETNKQQLTEFKSQIDLKITGIDCKIKPCKSNSRRKNG